MTKKKSDFLNFPAIFFHFTVHLMQMSPDNVLNYRQNTFYYERVSFSLNHLYALKLVNFYKGGVSKHRSVFLTKIILLLS